MSDLCIECGVSVSGRKHAITCDACERWQHRLCKTGISLADYRAAIKGEREIHFLCTDCCNNIPTLEPDGDKEPMDESLPTFVGDPVAESTFAFAADNDARGPLLQVSVPLDDTDDTAVDLQPPVLERSVPLSFVEVGPPSFDVNVPLDDTAVDLQPPILERSMPVSVVEVGPPSFDVSDATVILNVPYDVPPRDDSDMSSSFDISHRDVDDTLPIQEEDPSAGALDEVPGPRDNNNPVPAGMRLTVWS